MTFALAACGGSGSAAPDTAASTPAASTPAASAAGDSASTPEGETIRIGVSTDTATTVFRKVELMGLYSAAEAAGNVEIIEPVSYTHLDVYKRQLSQCFPWTCILTVGLHKPDLTILCKLNIISNTPVY